ncbi:HNH endonuclease [Cupriavidus alkaliphilus]|uniref:HNH endonuclease n=1 Tax=Cupriavidus alkaliphilus TaxID=942866 RepID=UPI000DE6DD33|nr:HNH endonuclease [Cupriavidus alkaliphilus]PVY76112.1 HNH endonuclease [Cupriavidus alkaliphilus]
MSAMSEIVAALQTAGVPMRLIGLRATQGSVATIDGYPLPLRLYAWHVTDNGQATGAARPADERRIQVSRTQLIDTSPNLETIVLGWCDKFGPDPLIVAFNPYSVARRVNGKIERKMAEGGHIARASDSQQFRQALLDQATANGIAFGPNQKGEYVIAMKPSRFIAYLSMYKPTFHTIGTAAAGEAATGSSMAKLISEAESEEATSPELDSAEPPAFDPEMIQDGRERVAREIAVRRGQAAFRRQLLSAYGCCAMSGSTVIETLEAAHIVPYQGPGTNHPSNGLLLRADMHTLFDLGLLAVDPQMLTILVAPQLNGTEYEAKRGQPLHVDQGGILPSREALQMHRIFAGI